MMNIYSEAHQQTKQLSLSLLEKEKNPSPELIRERVELAAQTALTIYPGQIVYIEVLVRELEGDFSYFVATGRALDDETDHVPWLFDKRAQIQWKFWDRYRRLLIHQIRLPMPVVNNLDDVTDQVLERLEDPQRAAPWDRRGLVVGSVQSGKTGNYTGLVCKAMDAGYKLIIILAGMHNSLRAQTQLRTDEGVTGFDTAKNQFYNQGNEWIGVGRLPGGEKLRINSLTTSAEKGDFNKRIGRNALTALGGDPYILIVKKNKSVLKNLLEWALRNGVPFEDGVDVGTGPKIIRDVPLLLIDDEADIASINTKAVPIGEKSSDYVPSAINQKIRDLLKAFDKSAYVGYTATPFANIFINPDDPEDIFPRSFILNLEQPENYVGPARVFGLQDDLDADIEGHEALPLWVPVEDHQPYFPRKYGKDHDPGGLPTSLKDAMRVFILSCAARRARGQETAHNSMLIHVARFINVQKKVREMVQGELKALQRRIEYDDPTDKNRIQEALRELWEREFVPKTAQMNLPDCPPLAWAEVEPHLHAAAAKIAVKEINGEAQDVLDYFEHRDSGRSVIAIGGDKLSRGLTLEGLSVSYYLRLTKMYDTLMQMGRWFGYRDGYLDLCRLYTTPELHEWYRHITLADLELRREFDAMVQAGRTPRDYGLRVRTHPDGMLVTALNKSRHGEKMRLNYTGELIQTTHLDKTRSVVESNLKATEEFVQRLGAATPVSQLEPTNRSDTRLWRNVSAAAVAGFLRNFTVNPHSLKADSLKLADYIEKQLEENTGDLAQWTVALISNSSAPTEKRRDFALEKDVGLTKRDPRRRTDAQGNALAEEEMPEVFALRKNNIISPSDQHLDFTGETVTADFIEQILKKRVFQTPSLSHSHNSSSAPIAAPDYGETEVFYDLISAASNSNGTAVSDLEGDREIIRHFENRSLTELAVEITRRRIRRGEMRGSESTKMPNGRVVRELRPDSRGLLLLYPLDPNPDPQKPVVNLETDLPLMGFAVSFPVSERARPIEYMVNEIYRQSQFESLIDEEE